MATIYFQQLPDRECPECRQPMLICGVTKYYNVIDKTPAAFQWLNFCESCKVVVTEDCEKEIGEFLWKLQNNRDTMFALTDWLRR